MAQWMTPAGTASAEVDLRVGGRFRLVMAYEHLRIEHTGEYQVIKPPALLVFTWRSEFTGMRDTLVTVRLTERHSHETEIAPNVLKNCSPPLASTPRTRNGTHTNSAAANVNASASHVR